VTGSNRPPLRCKRGASQASYLRKGSLPAQSCFDRGLSLAYRFSSVEARAPKRRLRSKQRSPSIREPSIARVSNETPS
jgi:hypothetical protein